MSKIILLALVALAVCAVGCDGGSTSADLPAKSTVPPAVDNTKSTNQANGTAEPM